MVKRHLDEVNLDKTSGFIICHVPNPRYDLYKIYKRVFCIDFKHLYNNILIQMYNHCLIQEEKDMIDRISYLYSIKSDTDSWRRSFNTIFVDFYKRNRNDANIVVDYFFSFCKSLLNSNQDNIIYIDTNMIILKGQNSFDIIESIDELRLPYEFSVLNYFIIHSKKNYCYVDGYNNIKSKGRMEDRKKMESNIIHHIREDRLSGILY